MENTKLTLIVGADNSICYLNGWRYKVSCYNVDIVEIIDKIKVFSEANVLYLTKQAENNYKKSDFPSQLNDYKEEDFE